MIPPLLMSNERGKNRWGICFFVIMMGVILRLGTRLKVVARERWKKKSVGIVNSWGEKREEEKNRLPFLNRHVIKIRSSVSSFTHCSGNNTKGLKGRRLG